MCELGVERMESGHIYIEKGHIHGFWVGKEGGEQTNLDDTLSIHQTQTFRQGVTFRSSSMIRECKFYIFRKASYFPLLYPPNART